MYVGRITEIVPASEATLSRSLASPIGDQAPVDQNKRVVVFVVADIDETVMGFGSLTLAAPDNYDSAIGAEITNLDGDFPPPVFESKLDRDQHRWLDPHFVLPKFSNAYLFALEDRTSRQEERRPMAPNYISEDVKRLRKSESEAQVTLLLGVDGDREALVDRIEQIGGLVDARLGRATLRVSASENLINELCELEDLKSIEVDHEDVQTLGSDSTGNDRSLPLLTR